METSKIFQFSYIKFIYIFVNLYLCFCFPRIKNLWFLNLYKAFRFNFFLRFSFLFFFNFSCIFFFFRSITFNIIILFFLINNFFAFFFLIFIFLIINFFFFIMFTLPFMSISRINNKQTFFVLTFFAFFFFNLFFFNFKTFSFSLFLRFPSSSYGLYIGCKIGVIPFFNTLLLIYFYF